jgi:hypothetical protein
MRHTHGHTCAQVDDVLLDFVDLSVDANFSAALKMETLSFSETLACTYQYTWRQNAEQQQRHLHRSENLKSHIRSSYLNFCEISDNTNRKFT